MRLECRIGVQRYAVVVPDTDHDVAVEKGDRPGRIVELTGYDDRLAETVPGVVFGRNDGWIRRPAVDLRDRGNRNHEPTSDDEPLHLNLRSRSFRLRP